MERRLTAFLLPALVLVLALLFFGDRSGDQNQPADPPQQQVPVSPPVAQTPATPDGEVQVPAQGQDMEFVRDFGRPGEIGFRVVFDRHGAAIRRVYLLDHYTYEESFNVAGQRDDFYPLVREEYEFERGQKVAAYHWFWLEYDQGNATPLELPERLQEAVWDVEDPLANPLRFSLSLGGGLVIERSYEYLAGRRDLNISIALRAAPGEAHRDAGRSYKINLMGLGLLSPKSEYVLGGNPARAMGQTRGSEDDETRFVSVASSTSGELQALVSQGTRNDVAFAGSTNRFFAALLYPRNQAGFEALYSVEVETRPAQAQENMPALSMPVPIYHLSLIVPEPGAVNRLEFSLYMGPKSFNVFEEQVEYAQLDAVVDQDLVPLCFCDIPGVQSIAHFLLWLLAHLHGMVGNWGWAIVLMTLMVRGSLVPLNFRMQKSMRAYGAKMAKLKPKLDALQKKHAKDKKALQIEMVKFQREHKMYPPIGGCLPMFITMPVFIGLFTALRVSYDLRQQPFMLWISDLSLPDALFTLDFAWMPYFNLLPVIMAGLWYWLQSATPLPKDPQQRQMMKMMRFMPVFMMVVLYNYASGLMIYMITSSLFGLVEQRIVRRLLGPVSSEAAAFAPQTPM